MLQKQFVADISRELEKVRLMLIKLAIRVVQLQFLALCVYLLCEGIAGPKDAVLWFITISLALLTLSIWRIVTRYRRR